MYKYGHPCMDSCIKGNTNNKMAASSRPGAINLSIACCAEGRAAIENRTIKQLMNKTISRRR